MNLIQSAHTLKSRSGKEFGKAWTVTSLDDAGVDELLPAGVEVGGRGAVAVGGRAVAAASSPAAPVAPPVPPRGRGGEEPARQAVAVRLQPAGPSPQAHAPEQLEMAADPRVGGQGARRGGGVAREDRPVDDLHRLEPWAAIFTAETSENGVKSIRNNGIERFASDRSATQVSNPQSEE